MSKKGIRIPFEADTSPLRSALSKIERESKDLQKSLKKVNSLLEFDPGNTTLIAQKQELLQKSIENTSLKLQAMEKAQGEVSKGFEKWKTNQQAIKSNATAISEVSARLKEAEEATQAMKDAGVDLNSEEFASAQKNVKDYSKQLEDLQKKQKELSKNTSEMVPENVYNRYITDTEGLRIELQQLQTQQQSYNDQLAGVGSATDEAAEEQKRLQAQIEKVTKAEKDAKTAADKYSDALDKMKSSASAVKDDLTEIGTAAMAGITAMGATVVKAGQDITNTGAAYTSSLSKVEALSSASAEALSALNEAAREAGQNSTKTAKESADALGYMALAGWDVTTMLGSLNPVLKASEAGEMDLARCSDLVTDSMSALGIEAKDLNKYLDIVTQAQRKSNTSMEQLLEAYIGCGGMMKKLNVSTEESASVLGILANRGIKASEAGTALNSILVNLVGASSKASTAMDELGVSAWNDGKFIGLTETLNVLNEALSTCTDEQRSLFEAAIGGKTQMDTLQALLAGVSNEYSTLKNDIDNSAGALDEMSNTMKDNLAGDLKSLESNLESVKLTVYDSIEEPFRDAFKEATDSVNDLNDNLGRDESAEKLNKIALAFKDLLTKSADFAADKAIPQIIDWLSWIADNSDNIATGIETIGLTFGAWKLSKLLTDLKNLMTAVQEVAIAKKAAAAADIALAEAQGLATAANTAQTASVTAADLTLKDYIKTLAATKAATMALYGVVALVGVVIAKAVASHLDEASAALRASSALDEKSQSLLDQKIAYEELSSAAKDNAKNADETAKKSKELWQKIKNLTDEYGNCTGSVEDLEDAISQFNSVSGQNIELVDGQVQKYQELYGSMEDIIELGRKKSKLDYLQQSYDEATFNIDDKKKELEETNKLLEELEATHTKTEEEAKRQEEVWKNQSAFYKWNNPFYESDIAKQYFSEKDQYAELVTQQSLLKQQISEYQEIMDEYESIRYDRDAVSQEEAMRQSAEERARAALKVQDDLNEEEIRKKKENAEKLQKRMDELDENLATHSLDASKYWSLREKAINQYEDKTSVDWWKYYDELQNHYEDEIEKKIETLKDKKELNDEYTEEMYYDEIQAIISTLSEESEVYKKYNAEILKYRKESANEASEAIKDSLKSDISEIETAINTLVSNYKSSLQQLQNEKENYYKKLMNLSDLTKTEEQDGNEVFSLYDPAEKLKELEELENAQARLSQRGISEKMQEWIEEMDSTQAKNTMDVLNQMTDEKLAEYSENFDKLSEKARSMASAKYDPQINELNAGFVEKINELLSKMPKTAETAGINTALGFANGIGTSDISNDVSDFCDSVINNIKTALGIHSPSTVASELGEYTAEGFADGLTKLNTGAVLADNFIQQLAEKDPAIKEALNAAFTDNINDVFDKLPALTDNLLSELMSGIKLPTIPTLPTFNTQPQPIQAQSISDKNSKTNVENDIIKMLEELKTIQKQPQPITLNITIDGALSADMDQITARIVKKINNLTLQTGKGQINL